MRFVSVGICSTISPLLSDQRDHILEQFGNGDKVCTRFERKGQYKGDYFEIDMLHVKTFKDGQIAHIWEYSDRKQAEKQKK